MTKAELRQQFLTKRKALSATDIQHFSQLIAQSLVDFLEKENHLEKINIVHIFLPIQHQNEVNTWPIIHLVWQKFPTIQVVVSITDPVGNSLTHYRLDQYTPLVENKWGIPEPVNTGQIPIESDQIDLVLIPLLIFDRTGHRVGYGGGYYDRFLAQCRPDCLKIGLSLFEPIEQIENTEPTDIRLDACVTPTNRWLFSE